MMRNASAATPQPRRPVRVLIGFIRLRLFQGLLIALPVAITFWIIYWLYTTLQNLVIEPVATLLMAALKGGGLEQDLPNWFEDFAAPVGALAIVLASLYFLGMFFQSRLHRALNWVLLRVPVVTTIYAAVSKMVSALQSQTEVRRFKRVVLIEFPHPGMKAPAFVTSSCRDLKTGRRILCLYVPTTPIPTSGYMLMIPEDDVIELNWDLNETLQAVVSGGISVPDDVSYYRGGGNGGQSLPPVEHLPTGDAAPAPSDFDA